jgi:hypothetical protein
MELDLLGRIVFAAPHGVVFVYDFDNRKQSPDWSTPEQVAAGTDEAIRIRVVHGQAGSADIRVVRGMSTADLIEAYRGQVHLEFGNLMVTDANEENVLVVQLEPGLRAIRICVDSTPWPRTVEIAVDEP